MQLYNIFNYIGRSGTTFLRNVILRMGDISCLETNEQFTWFQKYCPDIKIDDSVLPQAFVNRLKQDWRAGFYEHDIRNKYGLIPRTNQKSLQPKLLFKIPGYVMAIHCEPLLDFVRPILMLRHPVATVLSASNPIFLKFSTPLDQLYKAMKDAQKRIEMVDVEDLPDFSNLDIHQQLARLLCLSLQIHEYIITKVICRDTLVIFFEDLCCNFEQVLTLISTFFESPIENLLSQTQIPFYINAIEEGNIKMEESLKSEKAWNWINTTDSTLIDNIWSYLSEEAKLLGYSKFGCNKSSYIHQYSK